MSLFYDNGICRGICAVSGIGGTADRCLCRKGHARLRHCSGRLSNLSCQFSFLRHQYFLFGIFYGAVKRPGIGNYLISADIWVSHFFPVYTAAGSRGNRRMACGSLIGIADHVSLDWISSYTVSGVLGKPELKCPVFYDSIDETGINGIAFCTDSAVLSSGEKVRK